MTTATKISIKIIIGTASDHGIRWKFRSRLMLMITESNEK